MPNFPLDQSHHLEGLQDLVDSIQCLLLPPRHTILLRIIVVKFPQTDPLSTKITTRLNIQPGRCIVALQSSPRQASQLGRPRKDTELCVMQIESVIE